MHRPITANGQRLDLRVVNLDCEGDAAALRRGLAACPGVTEVDIAFRSAGVTVQFDSAAIAGAAITARLTEIGFPPYAGNTPGQRAHWKNPKVRASATSGMLLLLGWVAGSAGAPTGVVTAVYAASLLVGAYYFGREALNDVIREHEVGIEALMTVAAVVSMLMGAPGEGAMLAFLYSMSEAAEGYTGEKTRAAVQALMELAPKTALVLRGGFEKEIPVEAVVVGDRFIVKPGESMPTDGDVTAGHSSVNQAPVTGESLPVRKAPGDSVFAGTLNGEGALEVRATKVFAENTIARIIHMVEAARERKGTSERFIERFGKRYSPTVLAAGVLMAIVPSLVWQAEWMT
ncbi:MAG: hypothetical protein HY084_07825 [Gemmatimonadetes bacterium]|nr:hypothetical protein [Gemmatimonadota bacterium]